MKTTSSRSPWVNRIVGHESVDPQTLLENPHNFRVHGELQEVTLQSSIKAIAFIRSVTVNKRTGRIVDGHLRVRMAVEQKEKRIPVEYVHLTDAEERMAISVIDPISGLADISQDKLNALLTSLGEAPRDIRALLKSIGGSDGAAGDDADISSDPGDLTSAGRELSAKWKVKRGQIWACGRHILVCGDARDKRLLDLAFTRGRARLLVTDPPYGVNYVGKTQDALKIENDHGAAVFPLVYAVLHIVREFLSRDHAFYITAPHGPAFYDFAGCLRALKLDWRQTLVWAKNAMVLGHSDYHYKHECVFYGYTGKRGFLGGRNKTTVFETAGASIIFLGRGEIQVTTSDGTFLIRGRGLSAQQIWPDVIAVPRPSRSALHPTTKPVELFRQFIANSAAPGQIVIDPFCGSGTTLLACEVVGCTAWVCEIEASYASAILERYVLTTGEKPKLRTR